MLEMAKLTRTLYILPEQNGHCGRQPGQASDMGHCWTGKVSKRDACLLP